MRSECMPSVLPAVLLAHDLIDTLDAALLDPRLSLLSARHIRNAVYLVRLATCFPPVFVEPDCRARGQLNSLHPTFLVFRLQP